MSLPESAPSLESLLSHSEWLTTLARRLVADRATADDLVQDTWVAALRNPPREAHSLRAWLSRVARRLARVQDPLRSGRRELALAREACPPTDEVVARIEQERLLAKCVIELEEPYRTVVLQHFYRGLSAVRIAHLQGVPEATVRTRVRRALGLLREQLNREGGSDHWERPLLSLLLAPDPGALSSIHEGVLLMSTKTTVALSLASGVLSALAVTEVLLPRLASAARPAPAPLVSDGAPAALASPAAGDSATASNLGPAELSAPEAPGARQSGAQRRPAELSQDDLRRLLLSSKRIEQVQAIELLLQDESAAAQRILIDAFLSSKDLVLLALLQEALLGSPQVFAPAILDAFLASEDPKLLARLSGLLAGFAKARPELKHELVGHLLEALDDASFPDRAGAATRALVSLGVDAVDELSAYLVERSSGPAGVGSAAWAIAQLPGQHGALVREKLDEGLRSLDLEQWGSSAEERDAILQKTGSISWAASLRPEAEHDRLGEVLLSNLLRTHDEAQAGTLAWSIANLKGLSDGARIGMTRDLLGALNDQTDPSIGLQYASALKQLAMAQPEGRLFQELVQLVQDARDSQGDAGRLTPLLDQMLVELRASAKEEAR